MKHKIAAFIVIGAAIALAACTQSGATPTDTADEIPIVSDVFAVAAEGRLVPNDSVRLAFVTPGRVAEVLVAEGDAVAAGDVLARLGDREPFEAAVAGAELELAAADLEKSAAGTELLAAQIALEAIHESWPQQASLAQQALVDARERQYNAERDLGYLTTAADQTDIDVAFSQLVLAEKALEDAQEAFEPYENKPADNLVRAVLQQKLAEAQAIYDAAVRNYNALVDSSNEFDVSQAEAELAIANAQLAQAEEDYNELILGPDTDDIALAEARIASAEVQIAAADQHILTAQANLAAAVARLEDLDLVATISGTIVELDLIAGEQVAAGIPVVHIADFSSWHVETDNLTEIEVVDVRVGQTVTIVADALPDVTLTGAVEDIGDIFEENLGDVTYTAEIRLDEGDPRLRWGMTVVVTFNE